MVTADEKLNYCSLMFGLQSMLGEEVVGAGSEQGRRVSRPLQETKKLEALQALWIDQEAAVRKVRARAV